MPADARHFGTRMSARDRPSSRRLPSGAWSRLKTTSDPLENVGLPSKGDTRLHDFKAQEMYYNLITERYIKFCAVSGTREELEKQFASMSILNGDENSKPTSVPSSPLPSSQELGVILMAMRKLREAIVATFRHDPFAQRAYIFIIRAAILVKHMESYHPALLYLLHTIHPRTPLLSSELHEFLGYYILDLACRQGNYGAAYKIMNSFKYQDRRVGHLLNALVHDNWVLFWRTRRTVDGHQRCLIEWAEDRLRLHALKCLAKTYFTVEKTYVEKSADMPWNDLVAKLQIGWHLDGERIVIRKPRSK